ncbi:MAG: hypothetical protein GY719_32755 [bacterium]|nr:hypothetical protein [bacterium]
MPTGLTRPIRVYCLLAGACDAATGALLVSAPIWTLNLMRIAQVPAEPIYMRFIGTFVGGVGLAYLVPFVIRGGSQARLAAVLEVTALIRLCVALFLGVSIAGGALPAAWSTVLLTDLALGSAQIWMVTTLHSGGRDTR